MDYNAELIIFVFIITIMLLFIYFFHIDEYENFWFSNKTRYCRECSYKNRLSCSNCVNCGYCITPNGYGECVSGDENGPYFRSDCISYSYDDSYGYLDNYPYSTFGSYPYYKTQYYYDNDGYPKTVFRRYRNKNRNNRLYTNKLIKKDVINVPGNRRNRNNRRNRSNRRNRRSRSRSRSSSSRSSRSNR